MSVEQDVLSLRSRVAQLEARMQFLYEKLNIEYVEKPSLANPKIMELLKKGNKIGAIKVYREVYNVGLAEAKDAVEKIEAGIL